MMHAPAARFMMLLVLSLSLTACLVDNAPQEQSEVDKKKDLQETIDSLEAAEPVETDLSTEPIRRIINQRLKQRDTVPFSGDRLLQGCLLSYEGFTASDIKKNSTKLSDLGVNISTASFTLSKGKQKMEVQVYDLNGYSSYLEESWKVHNRDVDFKNKREINKSYKLSPRMVGYENVQRQNNVAVVSMLADNRFVITVAGTGFESGEFLRAYLSAWDLNKWIDKKNDSTAAPEKATGSDNKASKQAAPKPRK